MNVLRVLFLLAGITAVSGADVWRYQLLEGSQLITENLIVGGAPQVTDMRGSFDLRLVSATVFGSNYALDNVNFTAGTAHFTGTGTYFVGGEVAVRQTMTLLGNLQTDTGTQTIGFKDDGSGLTRIWPMLAETVKQTNGAPSRTYTMKIAAAPIREIWFSTAVNFHPGAHIGEETQVFSGDLLSSAGHVVKHNSDLQNFPGPTFENIGLDALDIRPGAEIAFSTDTQGFLSDGDIAFMRAGMVWRYTDLLKAFTPTVSADPGLDALSFLSDSEIYISLEQDLKGTTTTLHHGDLAYVNVKAQTGSVFRRNAQLLANFHPISAVVDYGLDAVFIWPSGEIWFSVRDGFADNVLGSVGSGDILSDSGYIVYRNLELLTPFAPIEDLNNFGLDTLTVISDYTAAPGGATVTAQVSFDTVMLSWTGAGRVFQVERASDVAGPYTPASNIIADLNFSEPTKGTTAFYRVRQW